MSRARFNANNARRQTREQLKHLGTCCDHNHAAVIRHEPEIPIACLADVEKSSGTSNRQPDITQA
jgi:hypothetical protein